MHRLSSLADALGRFSSRFVPSAFSIAVLLTLVTLLLGVTWGGTAPEAVLRGWGATCLLRPVPHVVCVRITRALDKRVEWLMGHLETEDAALAEAEVRRSDRAHAARMHELFDVTWGDPVLYDLVINTDRVTIDSAVEQIRALAARPEFAETEASRALLAGMALERRADPGYPLDAGLPQVDLAERFGADPARLAEVLG